jgi:hypothetical protein
VQEEHETSSNDPLGPLFSTAAANNAEVVTPDAPRGPESLWSTEPGHGMHPGVGDEGGAGRGPSTGPADPGHPTDPSVSRARRVRRAAAHLRDGSLFTAEPVVRTDDVVDEEIEEDLLVAHGAGEGAVAGNGSGADDPWDPFDTRSVLEFDPGVEDPHGLREAVAGLDPAAVEWAAVPIAVCGALLRPDEQVLAAVTGQMLGRPAVIVVTGSRVLVANNQRWQPIVDEFPIDSSLVVRGRHDRAVAALSFAGPSRLTMVEGITDVRAAVELAEHIRRAGLP